MTMDQLVQVADCRLEHIPDNCLVVIFGASGDLTGRKLLPALYNLFMNQGMPGRFAVVGAARTDFSDEAFRAKMRGAVKRAGADMLGWDEFAQRLHYQPVAYDDPESFKTLGKRLSALEKEHGLPGNRLFNLAVPPSIYASVALQLAAAKLSRGGRKNGDWVRLVVEKPFGYDFDTARRLSQAMRRGFKEHQIFRIDHYLAKETVQNIMMLRFANAIFEPLWNRNYIDHVRINASEDLGVGHRAGYYERSGVLRDMFQNHMMQLLALVAAEPPSVLAADRVRDEKIKLFRSLRPFDLDNLYDNICLGQYEAGVPGGGADIGGRQVPGYREEDGVEPESLTPTYANMKVYVDNWRWNGVPFYITSGKRLRRKVTRIDIQFKAVPHSLFRQTIGENIRANRLVLGIHPEEIIFMGFQAKRPGPRLCLRTAGLAFSYYTGDTSPVLDAYEKSLSDAMAGDQTLFWRQDGLEECWKFLDPILNACETCRERSGNLHRYPAGSWGPEKALAMLPEGSWPEKP